MEEDHVIEALKEPLSLSEDAIIFALPGGVINRGFLLNDNDNDYMVKVFIGSDHFSIDRSERFALQKRLATRKLAPNPIYLSRDQTLYAEQWIHQTKSQLPLFFDELHLDSLARTLARIHTCTLNTPVLNLPSLWSSYINQLAVKEANVDDKISALNERWHLISRTQKHHVRLCHNDLSWGHICGATGIILDWEYGAMGNRFFDLMSCAKINQLDIAQLSKLTESYAKHSNIKLTEVQKCCAIQADFVDMSYDLWSLVLQQSQLMK